MATANEQPKLTVKQRAFVDHYLGVSQYNATDAARRAGYKNPNTEGPRLLVNDGVRARIDQVLAELGVTRDLALALLIDDATRTDSQIAAIAFTSPSAAAGASAISSYVSARTAARTSIAKITGLLTNNVKITGRVDHVVRIPQGMHNLSNDDLDALEAIAAKAIAAEHEATV